MGVCVCGGPHIQFDRFLLKNGVFEITFKLHLQPSWIAKAFTNKILKKKQIEINYLLQYIHI